MNTDRSILVMLLETLVKTRSHLSFEDIAAAITQANAHLDANANNSFQIRLTDYGPRKIICIKVLREFLGLSLIDAKNLAESVPTIVRTGVGLSEARAFIRTLREAGAQAEIRTAGGLFFE